MTLLSLMGVFLDHFLCVYIHRYLLVCGYIILICSFVIVVDLAVKELSGCFSENKSEWDPTPSAPFPKILIWLVCVDLGIWILIVLRWFWWAAIDLFLNIKILIILFCIFCVIVCLGDLFMSIYAEIPKYFKTSALNSIV